MKFTTKRSVATTRALMSAVISAQLITGQVHAQTESAGAAAPAGSAGAGASAPAAGGAAGGAAGAAGTVAGAASAVGAAIAGAGVVGVIGAR